jgi:hypothetical protein
MKVILNASQQPYISIGVRFGGIKINNTEYIYHEAKDAFIDKKVAKFMRKRTWEEFLEYVKTLE